MKDSQIQLLGNLEEGQKNINHQLVELQKDVKTLLASHNKAKGISYAVSALVAFLTSIFTGKVA